MGQIFCACAYDIETKTCCVMDADKFHANCYAHSGAVLSMHYLLRQKPYRVMWGGGYVVIDDSLEEFSRTEDLLGISTYNDYDDFERNNEDIQNKSYYEKVKFIGDSNSLWNRIKVWEKAKEYFDWENTHSVKYCGYLVNHTQKLAVDLKDYHERSQSLTRKGEPRTIDALPVLTETGGGTPMALFNGVSVDSTEHLAEEWCGDLLQIVDVLPDGYEIIDCCFAEVWSKVEYCYQTFGLDEEGHLLCNNNGKLFEAARLHVLLGTRGPSKHLKVELTEDKIRYISV
ncbi:MAG: hypothetical protein FWG14_03745 [Peptococcaceae bacterium]|nr:hypothetical protein [Peptococcaceae bacterium]